MEISNIWLAIWMLHLEECVRKIDYSLRWISYGPLNMAGVYLRTSPILLPKSDFFKQVLQFENNIS